MGVIRYRKEKLADIGMSWNGRSAVNKIWKEAGPRGLRRASTWYDSEKPENKTSYKLPHHIWGNGEYLTVFRGVVAAMQSLLGARGGVNVPSGDKKGIYNHLARHYEDFGREAPEFVERTSIDDPSLINYYGMSEDSDGHKHSYFLTYDRRFNIIRGDLYGVYVSGDYEQDEHYHSVGAYFEDGELDSDGDPIYPFEVVSLKDYSGHNHRIVITEDDITSIVKRNISIVKRGDEKRLVYGVVLEPDVPDSHNTYVSSDDIVRVAHDFMMNFRDIGYMHIDQYPTDVRLVESFIAPDDMEIGGQKVRRGSWVIGVKVFDDLVWEEVKNGDLTGFSIYGIALK